MLDVAAVFFTITIPTASEEQRLKDAYRRQMNLQATDENGSIGLIRNSTGMETGIDTGTSTLMSMSLSAFDEQSLRLFESPAARVGGAGANAAGGGGLTFDCRRRLPTQLTDVSEHAELLDLPLDSAMEHVLQQLLRKFEITNAFWLRSEDGASYQITFTLEFNEVYENLYDALQHWGIGEREGSAVSVMNCIASKTYQNNPKKSDKQPAAHSDGNNMQNAHKQGTWNRFMNSVRSRLNVAQVVRDVRLDAAITFDFCILLISAAILASFGLIENSTIFLASSMLISPLMGPIIAAIFGTVIEERSLWRLGMRNELIGILLATLVGFLFGLVVCTTDKKYGIGEGLTEEMLSRCDLHSLIVGLFTAIPSGAAAAIGILGGNIGSLVGVAISASLLPPAVNSGLLWALACIYKLYEKDDTLYVDVVKSRTYSENQATELAVLGSISMCLTLSNILCIYLMGILVLKVKQIAPVIGRSNRQFWMHDIKVPRGDAAIIDELLADLAKEDTHGDILRHLDEAAYQHTWSPRSIRHSFSIQPGVATINRLEQLYTQSLTKPPERRPPTNQSAIERRHTLRLPTPEEMPVNRARISSMPSHRVSQPEIIDSSTRINVPAVPRFTVTPAAEELLNH
ncbi:hypothetical protein AWZ03_004162 [Drosophila navojoa]|uniref:DUF389 domain-containing protein n=1 Tax=Drosophila navojoa TaxID=7232 RepID=A0A484BKX1_DRONA|nr:uncharacterized protein LOC108657658 isoform X1 [Drosophila navojoa]TDG49479.1 hypothetical protein AWZ03_004162 [Drosophila navojoa]